MEQNQSVQIKRNNKHAEEVLRLSIERLKNIDFCNDAQTVQANLAELEDVLISVKCLIDLQKILQKTFQISA